MWLLAGQKAPDHSTIARFRTGFARGNKRLYLSKSFLEKRQESYENILSETGIKYRINRSIQVEGAFGVLKNDYGFQRFLLRGKTKAKLKSNLTNQPNKQKTKIISCIITHPLISCIKVSFACI